MAPCPGASSPRCPSPACRPPTSSRRKLILVLGFAVTVGVIIFSRSYIVGDVLTEVWGYAVARRAIWIGFACNAVMALAIWAGGLVPPAPFWKGQPAYEEIFAQTPRIVFASFVAYLVGEFANSFALARMKVAMGGRWLWMRTIGSTVVGQALDTAVFIVVAFAGVLQGRCSRASCSASGW